MNDEFDLDLTYITERIIGMEMMCVIIIITYARKGRNLDFVSECVMAAFLKTSNSLC